ncbi:MAG: acetolactate synthase AlsS [Ewingella americana]|jgi:acetolactate synthase-1/2/3 large subunit|uniref:Acetolactate synthase, catabolic n=1 Tax=Ewingella americana (strain ATCC 33852 / DSM 4580 / CCUG 14506 / JCM 5911 / LMG 7869 / NCTC 12157 / CDC 1468-78) TaxID=910964 RepID=A0A085GHR7_EWIA3|nr:acetolactate synthase AlsS [Ewingella americana]KAA8729451.1 acetolactate synthase AlsS [Ewingella americana]KFC83262.1 acetolactate synthase, catabolic [Ewingella americana ATCC 33852]MCI1678825.1 acetolactate synthase AlsS [Ewingella americana]MCI1854412.1 acetolactate synthase AlsS [Ewingella americana]MCI1861712.1 acetolactate synthase AlsS [Ewingella americana]
MKNSDSKNAWKCGADLVVAQLEQQGVKHVFGIPGAKIDRVFDSLVDSSIVTIPVRHEANAAFMAGAVGRLTSKAGVALVTSGPGCSNLITGVATATSEGDPLVAIGGAVKRADHVKQVHQTMDTVSMFRPVTKFAAEVTSSSALSEVLANGFRAAEFGRPGASFISLPMDIINEPAQGRLLSSHSPTLGSAPHDAIRQVSACLKKAKRPVLLLGLMASQPRNAEAIRRFLNKSDLPVTSTYQAAGVIEQAHFHRFAGRVGLFNNQAGDRLLRNADLVITVGYSPVEYEPAQWSNGTAELVHIDVVPAETDSDYTPDVELVGDIADTLDLLTEQVHQQFTLSTETLSILDDRRQQRELLAQKGRSLNQFAIHPLRLVRAMQDIVNSDVTLCVDMGSFHIWIARYLYSFRARQVLISNGQQTMGVALPWAIGAALVEPGRKVVSVSGDGGFMQSSMELETAVRLGVNLLHIIWVDDCYNMVAIQEEKKYQRTSGVKFGPIDFKAYAEAFGAKGFAVTSSDTLESTLRAAMDVQGPAVVAVPVDYSDNALLMGQLNMGEMF